MEHLTTRERDYLEVIYYLRARGEGVIAARIADWLKVSAPTVSAMLHRLATKGYIERSPGGEIVLTARGLELAEAIVRQHRLLECFLVDVMGMPWEVLHEEAVQMEHSLSERMQLRIEELVGRSPTCPHGNPVPGNRDTYDGGLRLEEAPVGSRFDVKRIAEEAEEDCALMAFLYHHRIVPGASIQVLAAPTKYGGVMVGAGDGEPIMLAREIAEVIWGDTAPPA